MGCRISRRPVRISAAAVLFGVLAGCGSAAPGLLDESARAGLHAQVKNIQSVLGNRTQATAAVERFRADVRRLRDRGELAEADAGVLLAHADQIESRVRAESPLPKPTPVAVVEPPKDADREKPDKGEGKGKGKKGPKG